MLIDLSSYDDMKNKLGAGGDFAQGYVITHEVGHYVQKLLGIEPKLRQMQQGATQAQVNQLSVKMELQSDCFAGVWGNYMQQQADILRQLQVMPPGVAVTTAARQSVY